MVHMQSPYNQARRASGHALGARYNAFSMIPVHGMYRVCRRRFAEARPDYTIGCSTFGSSGNGSSNIRLVSIATLSVSFSMLSIWAAKGKNITKYESSMSSMFVSCSSRRSMLVDVKFDLEISTVSQERSCWSTWARVEGRRFSKCGELHRVRKRINDLNSSKKKLSVHQNGNSTLLLDLKNLHVHNLYCGVLLHTLLWKHLNGLNNLFLCPLHNLNFWNFLNNNLLLYCCI